VSETALDLSRKAAEVFAARGIEQPRLDAELLLAHTLGVSRLQLYLQHDRPIADEELMRFRALVRRRLKREPVQYLVGTAHFRELTLAVDARVLIPRPETEELVGHVLEWAWARVGGRPGKERRAAHLEWTSGGVDERTISGASTSAAVLRDSGSPADGGTAGRRDGEPGGAGTVAPEGSRQSAAELPAHAAEIESVAARDAADAQIARPLVHSSTPPLLPLGAQPLTALDLGTGSGAIALSLLHEGPFARVVATDASAEALEVARANAARLGLSERVEFRLGGLWEAVAPDERFDVVASNPPYVAESERAGLAPELDWEPAGALFAGAAGFDVLEPLAAGAPAHLRPGGLLALEIGAAQGEGMRQRLAADAFVDVRVVRDLAGRDRVVLASSNSLAPERKRGEHA
jgi:release factor glutamine methyltransferase